MDFLLSLRILECELDLRLSKIVRLVVNHISQLGSITVFKYIDYVVNFSYIVLM